jgi:hypothetical protein
VFARGGGGYGAGKGHSLCQPLASTIRARMVNQQSNKRLCQPDPVQAPSL